MGAAAYDTIGAGYGRTRGPDPRIEVLIRDALGDAARVLNVGAGTGSYEPPRSSVVAVDPSTLMLSGRPPGAAPAVRGCAEALPFLDATFDAAMAVLTVHHWQDVGAGLAELRRVARRQIVLCVDFDVFADRFWFVRDYLPDEGNGRHLPGSAAEVAAALDGEARVVPVPRDCRDGFFGAHWRRPEAFFDPRVRDGISCFHHLPGPVLVEALQRLRSDVESGRWGRRNASILHLDALDLGYRLVVAPARSRVSG